MAQALHKRPRIISIFCVIGFIGAAIQIILISYPGIREIAKWYPIVYGAITALRFISLVGVWNMKKWAAELFTYMLVLKIIIQSLLNDFGWTSVLDTTLSVIFAITFMSFHRRMDRNL